MAHRAWVVDLLKEKKRSPRAIGKACLVTCVISPELALMEFGEEDFARAREDVAEEAPEPSEPLGVRELLPSCLGLPGATVTTSPECLACPAMGLCVRMETLTIDRLKRTTGSEDPEHERRKKQVRERVRRHREKKALAAGVSSAVTEPTHPT